MRLERNRGARTLGSIITLLFCFAGARFVFDIPNWAALTIALALALVTYLALTMAARGATVPVGSTAMPPLRKIRRRPRFLCSQSPVASDGASERIGSIQGALRELRGGAIGAGGRATGDPGDREGATGRPDSRTRRARCSLSGAGPSY